MEKEFVTYKQALALKELGFDEPCFGYYDHQIKELDTISSEVCERLCKHDTYIKAPTYSQAFRWFREKYNINSHIEYYPSSEDTVAYFFIADEDESINYGTYEEAEEKCIKFLIETVKNM
jgi:hypothetical protein